MNAQTLTAPSGTASFSARLRPTEYVLEDQCFGRTQLHKRIKRGLFTPPIKLGHRTARWPEYESTAIKAARIAGKSDDAIRELVNQLMVRRAAMAAEAVL